MNKSEQLEPDTKKIAVSDVDRFTGVLKYLHENGLLKDAQLHLQDHGFHQFMISVEPFREMQRFLRDEMQSGKLETTSVGNSVIMCGKGNASC